MNDNRTPILDILRHGLAEHVRRHHVVTVPTGTPMETLARPDYLLPVSRIAGAEMHAWDMLEVREETGRWWAQFLITRADQAGVCVSGIRGIEPSHGVGPIGALDRSDDGRSVRYLNAHDQWAVVDRDGNTVMKGMASEGVALAQLRDLRTAETRR
jgi:hypothetical protein